jgi:hypothetical protein
MGLSLQSRLEKVEQRARELGESNNNLVPLTIPWPEDYGGPQTYLVTPEFINNLVRAYGAHSQQANPIA